MTRRDATRLAYRIAYRFVQTALEVGGTKADRDGLTPEDQQKVEDALDTIAQRFYERANPDLVQRRCDGCGGYFSVNPQNSIKRYCKHKCKNLAGVRRHRQRSVKNRTSATDP